MNTSIPLLERPVPVWSPPWQFPDAGHDISEPSGPHPDAEDRALIIAVNGLDIRVNGQLVSPVSRADFAFSGGVYQ